MIKKYSLVLASVMLLLTAQSALAEDMAGVVTSVSGGWFVNGARVKIGQKVSVGSVIKPLEPNTKYARVAVMLLDYTELSRICDRAGHCAEPLILPKTVQPLSHPRSMADQRMTFWQRLVMAINKSNERRVVKTFARGAPDFSDQVVRMAGGGLDLEPVFRGTDNGEFHVTVRRFDAESKLLMSPLILNGTLNWKGHGPLILAVSDTRAGLYEITFNEARGQSSVSVGNVWVLAVKPPRYRAMSHKYEMARNSVDGWDRKGHPQPEQVLRAFLADLNSIRR
jgi:hypothetical protein